MEARRVGENGAKTVALRASGGGATHLSPQTV